MNKSHVRRLGIAFARVNDDHRVLSATHTFILHKWHEVNDTRLHSPAAQYHHTLAGTHFPPRSG